MARSNDTDKAQTLKELRAKLVKISNKITVTMDNGTDGKNRLMLTGKASTLTTPALAVMSANNNDADGSLLSTDIILTTVVSTDDSKSNSSSDEVVRGCEQGKALTECMIELVDYLEALAVNGNTSIFTHPTANNNKMLTLLNGDDADADATANNPKQAMTKLESLLTTANNSKRLTKKLVQQIVAEPISPDLFGSAFRYKRSISIREHRLAVRVIELIGKYGPMTTYQLRAWLLATENWSGSSNNDSNSPFNLTPDNSAANFSESLRALTTYALRHAQSAGLVSYLETPNWYNPNRNSKKAGHQVKLWSLERTGLTFYQMQTQNKSYLEKVGADYAKQKEHTFGAQQSLAIFNMVCATGKLVKGIAKKLETKNDDTNLITPIIYKNSNDTDVAPVARVEVMPWGSGISVPKLGLLKPDVLGRFVLEINDSTNTNKTLTDEGINRLTKAANIPPLLDYLTLKSSNPKLEEAEQETFTYNSRNELEWPFAIEYDRATESPEVFATSKYPKYAELYTQSFLSATNIPAVWQEKYPVVLVITEGSNKHLIEMMREVKNQIKANKSHHRYLVWWFTRLEWFKLAYSPYLNENNLTNWQKEWLTLLLKKNEGTDADSSKNSNNLSVSLNTTTTPAQRETDASNSSNEGKVLRSLATINVGGKEFTESVRRVRIWIPVTVMINDEQNRAKSNEARKPILALSQLNKLNTYFATQYRAKTKNGERNDGIIREVEASSLFKQMCSLPILHPLNLKNS